MLRVIGLGLLLTVNAVHLCGYDSLDATKVSPTEGRATQMNDSDANKKLIRTLFEEWVNKNNLAAVDQMVTATTPTTKAAGSETLRTKKFLGALYTLFPDSCITIEDILSAGDKVVVRNTWRAKQACPKTINSDRS